MALTAMETAWRGCEQTEGDVYPLQRALSKVDSAFACYGSPVAKESDSG